MTLGKAKSIFSFCAAQPPDLRGAALACEALARRKPLDLRGAAALTKVPLVPNYNHTANPHAG